MSLSELKQNMFVLESIIKERLCMMTHVVRLDDCSSLSVFLSLFFFFCFTWHWIKSFVRVYIVRHSRLNECQTREKCSSNLLF